MVSETEKGGPTSRRFHERGFSRETLPPTFPARANPPRQTEGVHHGAGHDVAGCAGAGKDVSRIGPVSPRKRARIVASIAAFGDDVAEDDGRAAAAVDTEDEDFRRDVLGALGAIAASLQRLEKAAGVRALFGGTNHP